jgi:alpha-1,3-rhamnosyl/mannosyltransferase
MASGTPVVCCDAGSVVEITAAAASVVPSGDVAAFAAALGRLLDDPAHAAEVAAAGRERSARFSWERCVRETLAGYEKALDGTTARKASA